MLCLPLVTCCCWWWWDAGDMVSDNERSELRVASMQQRQSKQLAASVRPAPRRPAKQPAQHRTSNARSTRQVTRVSQSQRRHLQMARVRIAGPFFIAREIVCMIIMCCRFVIKVVKHSICGQNVCLSIRLSVYHTCDLHLNVSRIEIHFTL